MATRLYEITPELLEMSDLCKKASTIDSSYYTKYDVKRGLRDENGRGVLVGLTEISDVHASKIVEMCIRDRASTACVVFLFSPFLLYTWLFTESSTSAP